jgi:arginine deiminase
MTSQVTAPSTTYGVHSEVGKLRKVLVCSPGSRIAGSRRAMPTTCCSTT